MKKIVLFVMIIFINLIVLGQSPICEDLLKDINDYENKGNYQGAKNKCLSAIENKCNNANYQELIKKYEEKLKQQTPLKSQKPATASTPNPTKAICEKLIMKGMEKFDTDDYEAAKLMFVSAKESGCSEAAQWIATCDKMIGMNATLNVATNTLSFNNAGGRETLQVLSNITFWTVSNVPAWCGINKSDNSFTLYCNENDGDSRTGTITVSAGAKEHNIKISQESGFSPLFQGKWRFLINTAMLAGVQIKYESGNRYKGEVNGKRPNGKGLFLWVDGTIYVGDWYNNNFDGEGIHIFTNGYEMPECYRCQYYVGEFVND
ncbi:MAG: hypothetical protein LBU51_00020, partial [Bacteroidales bacterium]|nr:hypothetical protein [Bacteroidales bacterium]